MARLDFDAARIGFLPERLKCRAVFGCKKRAAHRYIGQRPMRRCGNPTSGSQGPHFPEDRPPHNQKLYQELTLDDATAARQGDDSDEGAVPAHTRRIRIMGIAASLTLRQLLRCPA